MKMIPAKKLNMTQVWNADGEIVPVTVLEAEGQLEGVEPGVVINIQGQSKGRGTAGPVKRHGFHGAPASHGHDHPRAVGSIGNRFPQHTRPGMRMAGHMGSEKATVKNSVVVAVDPEQNLLTVKGGVPGHPQARVKVYLTEKKLSAKGIIRYNGASAGDPEPKAEESQS